MVLEWELPGADDLISEQNNALSMFYAIQWIPFIPIHESFIGTDNGYLLPRWEGNFPL